MATVVHELTGGSTANGTSYTTGSSFTPEAGDTIVVFVGASGSVDAAPTLADSEAVTYTLVGSALKNSSADRLYCFVSDSTVAAVARTLTYTCAGDAATGVNVAVYGVDLGGKVGLTAVVQSAKTENAAGGGTPAATFSSNVQTGNPTLGAVQNGANPAGLTEPSGWAEGSDDGHALPADGLETVYRDSGFASTTITWGGTSASAFGVFIVELDASVSGNPWYAYAQQ